jgi:hypothetical protein
MLACGSVVTVSGSAVLSAEHSEVLRVLRTPWTVVFSAEDR